jgi:hypothetical protein
MGLYYFLRTSIVTGAFWPWAFSSRIFLNTPNRNIPATAVEITADPYDTTTSIISTYPFCVYIGTIESDFAPSGGGVNIGASFPMNVLQMGRHSERRLSCRP